MTDLEALHWLRRMKATVLLDEDHACVIVPFGPRCYTLSGDLGGTQAINVEHRDGFAEVTAATLADATWQALQAWRARRGAVDGLADLSSVPPECRHVTSGVCAHCKGPTVEHTEYSPDDFKLVLAILCTACGAKTFLDPEETDNAQALGGGPTDG